MLTVALASVPVVVKITFVVAPLTVSAPWPVSETFVMVRTAAEKSAMDLTTPTESALLIIAVLLLQSVSSKISSPPS